MDIVRVVFLSPNPSLPPSPNPSLPPSPSHSLFHSQNHSLLLSPSRSFGFANTAVILASTTRSFWHISKIHLIMSKRLRIIGAAAALKLPTSMNWPCTPLKVGRKVRCTITLRPMSKEAFGRLQNTSRRRTFLHVFPPGCIVRCERGVPKPFGYDVVTALRAAETKVFFVLTACILRTANAIIWLRQEGFRTLKGVLIQ